MKGSWYARRYRRSEAHTLACISENHARTGVFVRASANALVSSMGSRSGRRKVVVRLINGHFSRHRCREYHSVVLISRGWIHEHTVCQ